MLLLLALGSVAGYGQVPGYLGKRFSLQGEFHSFPTLKGPTAGNHSLELFSEDGDTQNFYGNKSGGLGINWSAGAKLGYVVSRYKQVLFTFDYLKTGMIQTAYSPAISTFGELGYDSHYLFYNLTGLTAGLGTRKFKSAKGALAPMGMYRGYSLSVTYLKGEILDKQTTYAYGGPEHASLGTDPKHFMLSAGYEVGTNIIIKDLLLLNLGLKFNLALSPRALKYSFREGVGWYPDDGSDQTYSEGNTSNFKDLAAARFARHSFLMIYLGVGFIQ